MFLIANIKSLLVIRTTFTTTFSYKTSFTQSHQPKKNTHNPVNEKDPLPPKKAHEIRETPNPILSIISHSSRMKKKKKKEENEEKSRPRHRKLELENFQAASSTRRSSSHAVGLPACSSSSRGIFGAIPRGAETTELASAPTSAEPHHTHTRYTTYSDVGYLPGLRRRRRRVIAKIALNI